MSTNELKHVGVMGMHWGVRKNEGAAGIRVGGVKVANPAGNITKALQGGPAKSKAEFERKVADHVAYMKAHEAAVAVSKRSQVRAKMFTEKAVVRTAKTDLEIEKRKAYAKSEIEQEVKIAKERTPKGMVYDEKLHREKLNKIYAEDLNTTRESIHKERVKAGLTLAGVALAYIGTRLFINGLLVNALSKA